MIKSYIKKLLRKKGYVHVGTDNKCVDMEPEFLEMYEECKAYTYTSLERMYVLYKAVQYVVSNNIPGDFVECGVWKGGSVMLMAKTLASLGDTTRKIYMYDTYEGMTEPTDKDVNISNVTAQEKWENSKREEGNSAWCYSPIEEVKVNVLSTGYPENQFEFVRGMVEETIPGCVPGSISLLRLDTDFYESTYHELKHLYPLLSSGGILIIDDYGHWKGSKEATDQYIAENNLPIFLNRVDYAGRIAVKL